MTALAIALAGCGSSGSKLKRPAGTASGTGQSATTTTRTGAPVAGGPVQGVTADLVVSLQAPHGEPTSKARWPVTVRARTASGQPVDGNVSYAFLFGGAVVARRPGGRMRAGVYHDMLEFPAQAVGYPLTLEVIVQSAGHRGSVQRAVRVTR
ncbi:MAG: hypothetical protein KGJ43_07730 [Acidobacteriota bacterium]|nr:hypothetical protein [Acidobacteriota bacterium]